MRCSLCTKWCEDIYKADEYGWDWFTGYLPERFVACHKCLKTRQRDIMNMREKSELNPKKNVALAKP